MRAHLCLAAVAFALLVGPASALPPANDWILGRWNCRLGTQPTTTRMSWRYQPVACADNCSGGDNTQAVPTGSLGGQPIFYVEGSAQLLRWKYGGRSVITTMNRMGANEMRGNMLTNEGGAIGVAAFVCTRDLRFPAAAAAATR